MFESNDINKIFGQNLKNLRKSTGFTQEKLAELLGMQFQSISYMETGRSFVSSDVIAKICNLFEVSPYVLFRPHFKEYSMSEANIQKEIVRMLSGCDSEALTKYYNILVSLIR